MSHSEDLRHRVVKYVREGGSKAEASRRYGVGLWCVKDWLKRGDDLSAGKPGPKEGHKLDWQVLREAVKKQDDATLEELAEQFGVSHNAIWYALKRLNISRKKKRGLIARPRDMKSAVVVI